MIFKRLLIGTLITVIALFVLDQYLKFTRTTPPILKYYHDEYGALNVPNIKYLKFKEGLFLGQTNYDGRFREHYPKRKIDSSTFRIVLVGDSFVEGIDVYSRHHFATHMEDIMSKKLGNKVEVLNFGRGNCTLQSSSYYYLNYIKKEYDADLVLFFVEARDLSQISDYPSTSFVFSDSLGDIVASKSWMETLDFKLVKTLKDMGALYYLNNSGLFRLAYRTKSGIGMYGFFPKVFGKFFPQPAVQTYDRFEVNLEMSKTAGRIFDTLSKESGPRVLFILRNFPLESSVLQRYMDSVDYDYIDLKDTLDYKYVRNTTDDAYFFKATGLYGGHWNHLGHKAIGYFLSNRLSNSISRREQTH
jgi:hypothetical protein